MTANEIRSLINNQVAKVKEHARFCCDEYLKDYIITEYFDNLETIL